MRAAAAELVAPIFAGCVTYDCKGLPRNLSAAQFHAEIRSAAHVWNAAERLVRLDALAKEAIGMCPSCAVRS
jgi:hypothetical protein